MNKYLAALVSSFSALTLAVIVLSSSALTVRAQWNSSDNNTNNTNRGKFGIGITSPAQANAVLNTNSALKIARPGSDLPGSVTPAAIGDLDTSFDPGLGATVTGTVYAMATQSDGKIVLGGSFQSYNGVRCNGLARVNSDGSVDSSFVSGAPIGSNIFALAIQSDGKILLAGSFTSYNGVGRRFIARVNADGSLDSSFNPGAGAKNLVFALALQPDGKIFVGGIFAQYDGVQRLGIARINSDGSLDTSFSPTFGGPGNVYALSLQGDGKILLGGTFTQYGGVSRRGIARANSDGTLDTTFNPGTGVFGGTSSPGVFAIAIQADGKIVFGGNFFTYNGQSAPSIARVSNTGTLDTSFMPGSGASSPPVDAITIQTDGKILVGGAFFAFNGVTRGGVVRLNSNGGIDSTFDSGTGATGGNGVQLELAPNFNTVNCLALKTDGSILIGGGFTGYDGGNAVGIARLKNDGTLDTSLNPGTGVAQVAIVYSESIQSDGKIVIGGSFTSYNNVRRNGIARLNTDGLLDTSFNNGTGFAGPVTSLAIQSDGKIVVAGSFGSYNGVSRNNIVRLNADGSLDSSFDPGSGFDIFVNSIALQNDGKLVVGGDFHAYNGVPRNCLARINSNGGLDTSFDPDTGIGVEGFIKAVAIQTDGKVLIGGTFTSYRGTSRQGIARVNTDGTLDTTFNPGQGLFDPRVGASGEVDAFSIQGDGKIIIGGAFSFYDGISRNGIARVNLDGSLDSSFNPTPGVDDGSSVLALAMQSDGKVLAGGVFATYNGVSRVGIARVNGDGSLDTSFSPGAGIAGGIFTQDAVYALAIQADGKVLLGGGFDRYNGVGRNGIARVIGGPASGTVQLSASSYSVNEADLHVDISVVRGGDSGSVVSVDYATSDAAGAQPCGVANGLASSRCNYITTLGTLKFAAGDISKIISIPIINSSYAEGNKTFTITLSNPTGATLGSPVTATITIINNRSSNGVNPVDTADFFVRQHYIDFLNREPDAGGLSFWSNEITSCGADASCTEIKRINVSAAFFVSIEFQNTGYLVERIHKAAFGDGSNSAGGTTISVPVIRLNEFLSDTQQIGQGVVVNQPGWEAVLENNKQAFALSFVQRTRFASAFLTTMTPGQFVDALFVNAGVTPAPSDRTTAINEFSGAADTSNLTARSRALRDVAENATLNTQEFNRAFVLMQYFGYMRRNPNDSPDTDYAGWQFWLTKLNAFNGNYINAEMVKAFISSSEYRQRFGP